jgi:hypothetical protein
MAQADHRLDLLYVFAIVLSFVYAALGGALYALVAIIWLVPDRRIEHALAAHESRG